MQISLTFHNQTLLNFFWADPAEKFSITIRFSFFESNGSSDPEDEKKPGRSLRIAITTTIKILIRIDQGLVSCTRSGKPDNPSFHLFRIAGWVKE